MRSCGLCGGKLRHLLTYSNLPAGAQHLPENVDEAREQGIDLLLCQCEACGVAQLANEPVSYWRDVIRAVDASGEMRAFRREQFADFASRHNLAGAAALELGCGDGAYLKLLGESGLRAIGLEHSQTNVDICARRGLTAHKGYIEETGILPEAPFHAFFVFSWLEHLPSIPAFFAALRGQLSQGAIGLVEVPNFDMILKENLFSEFIIDHLYYFTRETFSRMLANNGFEVLSCKPVWHDYILSAEIRQRQPLAIEKLQDAKNRLAEDLRALYAAYPRIALWGAGHQALTLIAMAGDCDALAYIVDSAPFKQGRFSPVSGRPILPPETLLARPVDALIVAAGSYSDEVRKIACGAYGLKRVFVLRHNRLEPAGAA